MQQPQQGVNKFCDVVSERQKIEIIETFTEFGEMCFSMLLKKGKDTNKAFANNTSVMGLISSIIDSGTLSETRVGTCPYTGKNAQYWNLTIKFLNPDETISQSFKNVVQWMDKNQVKVVSRDTLFSMISKK